VWARRLVGPLVANMTAQGVDRAQVAVSILLGVRLGRSRGWFDEIQSVPRDEPVALIVDTLGSITEDLPSAIRPRRDPSSDENRQPRLGAARDSSTHGLMTSTTFPPD
jgi:hypothetical protein